MKRHLLLAMAVLACLAGLTLAADGWGQAPAAAVDMAKVDAALKDVAAYEFGQTREPLTVVSEAVRDSQGNAAQRKDLEQKFIALLKGQSTLDAKDFAVRQLMLIGTDESIPALAPMLEAKDTANLARYALEHIPGGAADKALLAALAKVQDAGIKVGIVNSLGQRKTADAVEPIAALLQSADAPVVEAAMAALGKIGNKAATLALAGAKPPEALHAAWADAYMVCADKLLAEGKKEAAGEIFAKLNVNGEANNIRVAAFRGQVMAADVKDATRMVVAAIAGDNLKLQEAATFFVRKGEDKADTEVFAALLPRLNGLGQVLLVSALADRGDKSALPSVVALASSEIPAVRIVVFNAVGKLGNVSSITMLAQAGATTVQREERDAARNALDILQGNDIDSGIVDAMKKAEPPARAEMARSLAARNAVSAVPALFEYAKDADGVVSAESFKSLGVLAAEKDLPTVVELLAATTNDGARGEAEKAVVAVSKTIADEPKRSAAALAVLSKVEDTKVRASFYSVLGQLGDANALAPVRDAAEKAKDAEQDAAVRAMSAWPNAIALDDMMKVAETTKNDTHKVLALRGVLHMLEMPTDKPKEDVMKYYEKAIGLAKGADEKRLVLGALANVKNLAALALVKPYLGNEELKQEANVAAEKIKASVYKASASANPDEAGRALDGKLDSRWNSAANQVPGQWFAVDLGAEYMVGKIVLDAAANAEDCPRGYQVLVGSDMANLGGPVAEGKGNAAVTEISFTPKAGRYIKIIQTGTAEKNFWSIAEVKIESQDVK